MDGPPTARPTTASSSGHCTGSRHSIRTPLDILGTGAGAARGRASSRWGSRLRHGGRQRGESEPSGSTVGGPRHIELDYGPPGEARNWVDGYNSNTSTSFYDVGDAAGCAQDQPAGAECGTQMNPGWNAVDVWRVSDYANAIPLPQIYTGSESMAKQWKWLSIYAYQNQSGRMNIRGSATQHQACAQNGDCAGTNNTLSEGWNQLKDKLQSDSRSNQPTESLLATDWKWTDPE